jgi:cytosine/uracil/thiamine/allantoin permease
VDGLIPLFKPFADYSWMVGLFVSFFLYGILSTVVGDKAATTEA